MEVATQARLPPRNQAPSEEGAHGPRRLLRPWREALRTVLLAFAVSRLLLVLVTCCVALTYRQSPLALWDQWDSRWYIGIATHGYHWTLQWWRSSLAFFPLYPLLIRLGMASGLPPDAAAMVVSNAATVGALFYLYFLTKDEWGPVAARRAIWVVVLFPTAFFTFAPYSEPVFLLCAAACFYHARRQQAPLAGLWVAGAVLTRSTGLVLVPPVLALLGPRRPRAWLLGVGPTLCALGSYAAYLASQHLSIAEILPAQHGWHRALTYPWMGFWASIHWLLAHGPHPVMWAADNVGELIVTVCFLALTAVAWRSFDRATALYCAGFWLLVLTSPEWMNGYFSPLSSTDRFILALFPLAGWAPSRIPEARLRPLLVVSAVFLVGTAAYHATGGWVG